MTLPKELEQKRDELSYSYEGPSHRNCMGCCQSDSDYQKTFEHGFNAGVTERDKYLARLGDGFDEQAAIRLVEKYVTEEVRDEHLIVMKLQFEQSKLKYQSHLQMLRDHAKEDSNEIVKLNNIIHKQQAIIEKLKEQRNEAIFTADHDWETSSTEQIEIWDKELAEIEGKK